MPRASSTAATSSPATTAQLAERVSQLLTARGVAFEVKRMMGGYCFMVDGKMCVGVETTRLMARIGLEAERAALQRPGCRPMDFTGRPMRGYVFVDSAHLRTEAQLGSWLDLALAFNPLAKAAAKKK